VRYSNREMKPAREYFDDQKTMMYSSLSATPFNSLLLSTESAIKARRLPVDLAVLSQLAAAHAKQGRTRHLLVKAKFHYTSWFGASSELATNMFGARSEPASVMEFGREPARSC